MVWTVYCHKHFSTEMQKQKKQNQTYSIQIYWWKQIEAFLPQDVLMASRNSAYFHLLSSYFLTSGWAFVAVTCGALNSWKQHKQNQMKKKNTDSFSYTRHLTCLTLKLELLKVPWNYKLSGTKMRISTYQSKNKKNK